MEYTCSACNRKIAGDMMVYLEHTDAHIIELVKHDHPGWVEKDGVCQQCVEYYRKELQGGFFGDVPCALRNRKIKSVVSAFKNLFSGQNKASRKK